MPLQKKIAEDRPVQEHTMARSGNTTRERAREAFIELIRERERPTVPKIRTLIGGGGTDVIRSVIEDMEAELYQKQFGLATREDVPPVLVDGMLRIWEEVNRLAEARFASEKARLEREAQEATTARDEARSLAGRLQETVEELQTLASSRAGECSALRTALEAAESRALQSESEASRARRDAEERIAAADSRATEQIRTAETRYAGLEKHLHQSFDAERRQLRDEAKDLRETGRRLADQVETLSTEKAELASARDTALVRLQAMEQELARCRQDLKDLRSPPAPAARLRRPQKKRKP